MTSHVIPATTRRGRFAGTCPATRSPSCRTSSHACISSRSCASVAPARLCHCRVPCPLDLNVATAASVCASSVLSCNKLETLPHWVGDLHKLKELWLVDNPALTDLPRQLEECSQLRRVISDAPLQKAAKQVLNLAKMQREADYFEKFGVEMPAEVSLDAEARRAGDDDDAGGASDGDKSFLQTVSSTCVIQ